MNEITFYAGRQPDANLIAESQEGLHTLSLMGNFQEYFSLSYLFILLVLPRVRSFSRMIDPRAVLFKVSKWTIELLSIKSQSRINFSDNAPNKNINPDVSHQKNINDMYFKTFRVRPLTFSDLARLYHVTRKTIRRRAKRIGIVRTIGNFLSVAQINLYIQYHGWPRLEANRDAKSRL